MLKAVMFGAGGGGKRLYSLVKEKYEIVGIVDNDKRKLGTNFYNLKVEEPKMLLEKIYDRVVLTCVPGKDSIIEQLRQYGITEDNIDMSLINQPLESRRIFLKNFAKQYGGGYNRGTSVAEAGVFQGDFAKYINEYFPDRKLFLFDTWSGFDSRDISIEKNKNFSSAEIADYANTSAEMVIQKMLYPSQVIIKSGYFPESAMGLEERFCFVNMDLDLYKPTIEGLKWFDIHMDTGGVILVHDYFTDNFRGVKQAVNEYMQIRKELFLLPIGDGISIAICGY